MNPSEIKQAQDHLYRLSKLYTQQDLDLVMQQNQNITSFGLSHPSHPRYVQERVDLKNSLVEFQLACAFLSNCKRTKAINYKNSLSYWLKHRLEGFIRPQYISNGAIIVAADCLGIKYVEDRSNPSNVWLAISKDIPITDDMNEMARSMR